MEEKNNWIKVATVLFCIGIIFMLIIVVWIICVNKVIITGFYPIDFDLASKIGAFIGGTVGVFWSGAGIILIYATFKKQHDFSKNQAFDQTFQTLMGQYNSIINNIKEDIIVTNGEIMVKNKEKEVTGRKFFSLFLEEIKNGFSNPKLIEYLIKKDNIPEIKDYKSRYPNTFGYYYIQQLTDELITERTHRMHLDEGEILKIHTSTQILKNEIEREKNEKQEVEFFNIEFNNIREDFSIEMNLALYEFYHKKYQNIISHTFRFMYHVLKYIIKNKECEKDKKRYIKLVQSYMSNDELIVLFYNCLSKYGLNQKGENNFKKMLEKYNFFENIDLNSLLSKKDSKQYNIEYKFT